jgi:predicted Zn-dependent protease
MKAWGLIIREGLQLSVHGSYGDDRMPLPGRARSMSFFCLLAAVCVIQCAFAQENGDDAFQALLERGFDLHRQARFTDAIAVLEQARRIEPRNYFANLLLGIDLLRTGNAAAAVPRLEYAARIRPGEEIPEGYLGEAEADLGHYARAAEAYRQAVDRSHGSEDATESWAGFAMERFRAIGESLRSSVAGVSTVRRLQAAATKPAATLTCQGSIPVLERKLALEAANPDMETAYRLSICYAVEAGNATSRLKDGAGDRAALHRLRGDIFLRLQGDANAAKNEYEQAIALQPRDPALEERLAEAEFAGGNADAARQAAQAALAIDPQRRDAMQTLASIAMDSRDYSEALKWLRPLAEEEPADRNVQVEFGRALAQTGEPAAALQHLAPALAAGYPDEKGALHALEARVLRELGRDAEAARAAAEARRLSDSFQARNKDGAREGPDDRQ